MLPNVPYGDRLGKKMQTAFYGLNHTPACGDGELYDCENLSAARFPLLSPRKKRSKVRTLTKANGLGGRDVLMWVDGTEFFYNGTKKGNVADSFKTFYYLGPWVIIWPDKAFYNVATDTFGNLEEAYVSSAGAITFSNGTFAGENADANTITTSGTAFAFEVGDAVTISGCATHTENNITAVIKEISDNKKSLRFLENIFTLTGTSYAEPGAVTIKRAVPDMDFLCENENRLWGVKGDSIYCSNLGNPKVWQDYEGLATGSWSCDVGSAGDFTGAQSYLSYAICFKAGAVHKVFGTKPTDFKYTDGPSQGVMSGCEKSFAVAGETLFYRSPQGIVRYNGGYPYLIDANLSDYSPRNAVAGSDGRRYYVSGTTAAGTDILLCYDTESKIWLREDGTRVKAFANAGGLYFLKGNEIWSIDGTDGTKEASVAAWAELGDFYEGSPNKKEIKAFQIRSEGSITVYVKFDADTQWTEIGTLSGGKDMHKLEIPLHRCDHWRMKLVGTGDWTVYAISREFSAGTDNG